MTKMTKTNRREELKQHPEWEPIEMMEREMRKPEFKKFVKSIKTAIAELAPKTKH